VNDVSFDIAPAASFAIVGESGSGKSTLARTVLALERPIRGDVLLNGDSLFAMDGACLRAARRRMSIVFQDPYDSLDPRLSIGSSIGDPLDALESVGRKERAQRVAEALIEVGLRAEDATRFPHQLSGGQRQRVAIARALITKPELIVADEPVSSLDVSVQAQVLNLLRDLRERRGVAYLFISHNLAVVRYIADEIAVMREGRFVERGKVDYVFSNPQHSYTRGLLAAVLSPRAQGAHALTQVD
jgi:peptide/nickel transport system ATP-binding protein